MKCDIGSHGGLFGWPVGGQHIRILIGRHTLGWWKERLGSRVICFSEANIQQELERNAKENSSSRRMILFWYIYREIWRAISRTSRPRAPGKNTPAELAGHQMLLPRTFFCHRGENICSQKANVCSIKRNLAVNTETQLAPHCRVSFNTDAFIGINRISFLKSLVGHPDLTSQQVLMTVQP